MKTYLIIQTAFIGDVILATSLIESIANKERDARIDVLVRKGNEGLLIGHPRINEVLVWDKKNSKFANLNKLIQEVKKNKYDVLLNLQRFGSTGYLSWRSRAKTIVGFDKNPFSFSFTKKVKHEVKNGQHEIERNHKLLQTLGDFDLEKPKLYPSEADQKKVNQLTAKNYYVLAPASVWFTKQMPASKWIELMLQLPRQSQLMLIGAPNDQKYLDELIADAGLKNCINLAGELSLLQSAALMRNAQRVYVNDSAPLHLASAVNARVTAFFCSTIPAFGFGPLSSDQKIIQIEQELACRPCGLHGKSACPETHFNCGQKISVTID